MTRWEIWRVGETVWLEAAAGRHDTSGQRCVARFTATAEQAASHLRFVAEAPR